MSAAEKQVECKILVKNMETEVIVRKRGTWLKILMLQKPELVKIFALLISPLLNVYNSSPEVINLPIKKCSWFTKCS